MPFFRISCSSYHSLFLTPPPPQIQRPTFILQHLQQAFSVRESSNSSFASFSCKHLEAQKQRRIQDVRYAFTHTWILRAAYVEGSGAIRSGRLLSARRRQALDSSAVGSAASPVSPLASKTAYSPSQLRANSVWDL